MFLLQLPPTAFRPGGLKFQFGVSLYVLYCNNVPGKIYATKSWKKIVSPKFMIAYFFVVVVYYVRSHRCRNVFLEAQIRYKWRLLTWNKNRQFFFSRRTHSCFQETVNHPFSKNFVDRRNELQSQRFLTLFLSSWIINTSTNRPLTDLKIKYSIQRKQKQCYNDVTFKDFH